MLAFLSHENPYLPATAKLCFLRFARQGEVNRHENRPVPSIARPHIAGSHAAEQLLEQAERESVYREGWN